jgi:hypothetical protein
MRVAIVDPGRFEHYSALFEYLEQCSLLSSFSAYNPEQPPEYYDIVLTSDEWCSKSSFLIAEAKYQGIPTLHIADGITKWGNVWENPRSKEEASGLPMFQPVVSDKIACIGPLQARLFSSWGQHQKVEATGLPRFDRYVHNFHNGSSDKLCKRGMSTQPLNILVILANKPGYTDAQIETARQSLVDLNDAFAGAEFAKTINVTWRLGPTSPQIIPSPVVGNIDNSDRPIIDILQHSDAVIASPSTAVLEAMSMDIPTCILDYLNKPEFLQAAWVIRNKESIQAELKSLFAKDERRMLFQRYLLHDQFRLDSPASPRVANLMLGMISIAKQNKDPGAKHLFPANMSSLPNYASSSPYHYAPHDLFPAHPLFSRSDSDEMACELGHLRLYCRSLENSLRQTTDSKALARAVLSRIKAKLFSHRFYS